MGSIQSPFWPIKSNLTRELNKGKNKTFNENHFEKNSISKGISKILKLSKMNWANRLQLTPYRLPNQYQRTSWRVCNPEAK